MAPVQYYEEKGLRHMVWREEVGIPRGSHFLPYFLSSSSPSTIQQRRFLSLDDTTLAYRILEPLIQTRPAFLAAHRQHTTPMMTLFPSLRALAATQRGLYSLYILLLLAGRSLAQCPYPYPNRDCTSTVTRTSETVVATSTTTITLGSSTVTSTIAAATTMALQPGTGYTGADFQDAVLNSTNLYRSEYQVEPLEWDDDLASYAEDYAKDCIWEHSVHLPFVKSLATP